MKNLGVRLTLGGIMLSLIGVTLIIAGLIMDFLSGGGGGTVSFGGVVVIGPIPLVFGSDKTAILIGIAGAVILMVIVLAASYWGRKSSYHARDTTT